MRCKNGMYFFTKIADAPELGKDETKFVPVKAKDVPSSSRCTGFDSLTDQGAQSSLLTWN